MYKVVLVIIILVFFSCKTKTTIKNKKLNTLAEKYVKLALVIGQYDVEFVDAYYGPDSLKPITKNPSFPKDSLLKAVENLSIAFNEFNGKDTLALRASWIKHQLTAFARRIKIFSGETGKFDEECKDLYGAVAPIYTEQHYKELVNKLDNLLPGKGSIQDRYQAIANKFIIPKNKIDTVFKAAIDACRNITKKYYKLPSNESFTLEYVTNKPWGGYNWYKGNYTSLIQINTDLNIFIDRAIDVGSHESYPGHHVYNMLLEEKLYNEKGWIEISMYPLHSPQSLIAEGSANYGIDMAFPGNEKVIFTKNVLLPIAGLDTTGISIYFNTLDIRNKLNYARNEVGRGIINGTMQEAETIRWLKNYCLMNDEGAKKSISFISKNRSYIINYNYGKDLVKNYIETNGGKENAAKQWELFGWLLSNEVKPSDLLKK